MIRAADLIAFHDGLAPRQASPVWEAIESNHRHNGLLWAEEDLARRRNVSDSEIAANKRAIDGYNQKRNDAIERIEQQPGTDAMSLPPAVDGQAREHQEGNRVAGHALGNTLGRSRVLNLAGDDSVESNNLPAA